MAKLSPEQAREPVSRGQVIKKWIWHHKIETTAILVCLFGAIVILCLVFVGGDSNEPVPAVPNTQTPGDSSPSNGDSPTDTPVNGGGGDAPPPAPAPDLVEDSPIFKKLALLTDLQDTSSPQYRAADWLIALDFLKLSASSPSLEQRFALATFYLATGGGLTTKEGWTRCSAVPPPTQNQEDQAASNIQCVVRDGKVICAEQGNFEVCEFTDEEGTVNQGKRFLSPVNECEWFGITCDDNGVVTLIDIESNDLVGELPSELALLTGLTRLNLSNNTIGGWIPMELGLLEGMSHFLLTSNKLEGDIPSDIYYLPLKRLELERNALGGSLHTDIGNLNQLQVLYINHNLLEGALPSELGQLASLRKATFNQNKFSGQIPEELGQLENLQSIKFANNDLSGVMPGDLCESWIPISADCLADNDGEIKVVCECCDRCCNADGRCRDL